MFLRLNEEFGVPVGLEFDDREELESDCSSVFLRSIVLIDCILRRILLVVLEVIRNSQCLDLLRRANKGKNPKG